MEHDASGEVLEWEGKSLHWMDWAKELGITLECMQTRLSRVRTGQRDYRYLFKKPQRSHKETDLVKKDILYNYLRGFQRHCKNKLDKEFKTYSQTGEKGPAMKWIENNKALIMNTKTQEHTKADKPANLAIFVGGDIPKNITVIEQGGQ